MTATPRTDKAEQATRTGPLHDEPEYIAWTFARSMERENGALRSRKPKTRKRLIALLEKRRKERDHANEAHAAVLRSYSALYDEFMRERRKVEDLERRLSRLVTGYVEEDFSRSRGEVCCTWRVSKMLLKLSRDREVVWQEAFAKLRTELFRWQETK